MSAVWLLVGPTVAFAQTITSPVAGSTTVIKPWKEYATHELRDAWDMNKRTDIGFFTWGIDDPASNMAGKKITTDTFNGPGSGR